MITGSDVAFHWQRVVPRSDAAARGNPDERTATGRRAVVSGL